MNKLIALKTLLAVVAAYHLLIGIAATTVSPGDFADWIITVSYGASFEIDAVTHHIIRILGAFMIFVGVLAVFAFYKPRESRTLIYGLVILFLIRVVQRIVFADDIQENFDIGTLRLVIQAVFFVGLASLTFSLRSAAKS